MYSLRYQNLKGDYLYLTIDINNPYILSSEKYPVYIWNIHADKKGITIRSNSTSYYLNGDKLSQTVCYWSYDSKFNILKSEKVNYTPKILKTSLGICNWSGLYKFTNKNLLEEGREVLSSFNCFNTIKLYLGKRSSTIYKLETNLNNMSLVEIAKLSSYVNIFKNSQFKTIILVCHSTHRKSSNYWNIEFTEADKKSEIEEFHNLASYLRTFKNKDFIIQNWESDNYKHRTLESTGRMIKWIKARQAGIDIHRKDILKDYDVKRYPVVEFSDNVFHAIEVNRVKENKTVVYDVLPHIRVDLVSYSCYETQENPEHFKRAIDIILSKINRTRNYTNGRVPYCLNKFTSPLYIGEFGLSHTEKDEKYISQTIKNVIAIANMYKLPFVNFWNLYNNEKGRLFGLIDSSGQLTYSGNIFKNIN